MMQNPAALRVQSSGVLQEMRCLVQLDKQSAVWAVQRSRKTVHNQNTLCVIDCKICDGIRILIQTAQVFSVREDQQILRIFPADGENRLRIKKAGFLIPFKKSDAVVSCVGAENVFLIRTDPQSICRIDSGALARQCGDKLFKFKFRIRA